MSAVLRVFSVLGSVLGLAVWLGGAALVAFALTQAMGSSPDQTTELAKLVVIIAGVVVALVASVILLRVTRNLIWFFVCFACGAFAALAGAGFNPGSLSGEKSLLVVSALAIVGVSVVVLAVSKRMVPFLVTLGVLGALTAGAFASMGVLGASVPMEEVAVDAAAPKPVAPPIAVPTSPAAPAGAQKPAAAQEQATAEAARQAEIAAKAEAYVEARRGQLEAAPPKEVQDQLKAARDQVALAEAERAVREQAQAERSAGEARAAAEAQASAAARPRTGATRGLRPPAAAPPSPPPPPPMAAAPEAPAGEPAEAPPTAAITEPPAPTTAEPAPVVADVKPSDFQMAELKFNKPDQMEIDVPETVSATIAGKLAETQATLGTVGPTVSRQVQITRKVRVELVADDFDIKKLHTVDTVLITPETSGQWSWQVTPRRVGGERTMLLQVYGVIERDGVPQGETLIKTYEEKIPVKVTLQAQVRLASQGIVDRWQPIAGALGVIGGIWVFLQKVFAALTRRRKAEQA